MFRGHAFPLLCSAVCCFPAAAADEFATWVLSGGYDVRGQLTGNVFGATTVNSDMPWPQISAGVTYTRDPDAGGGQEAGRTQRSRMVEPYVTATKLWVDGASGRSVLFDATLRYTRANPFGILSLGGDRSDSRCLCWETSGTAILNDHLVTGIEWRRKPNLLNAFQDHSAYAGFVAWVPSHRFSFAAAYVDFGDIAGRAHQQGPYLSLKLDLN